MWAAKLVHLLANELAQVHAVDFGRVDVEPISVRPVGNTVAQRQIPVTNLRRHRIQHCLQRMARGFQVCGALVDLVLQGRIELCDTAGSGPHFTDITQGLGQAYHAATGINNRPG